MSLFNDDHKMQAVFCFLWLYISRCSCSDSFCSTYASHRSTSLQSASRTSPSSTSSLLLLSCLNFSTTKTKVIFPPLVHCNLFEVDKRSGYTVLSTMGTLPPLHLVQLQQTLLFFRKRIKSYGFVFPHIFLLTHSP